ncbi:MAG TPA: TolC family protein [Bacteroidales bacterium]|nr:TolC family protein [Bacteroidales bacterium]
MTLILRYFIVFIILGLSTELFCQDNNEIFKLSISEAQEYALQNNRTVISAKINVDIATKQIKETVGIGLPQLNLATNYQHQFVVPQLSFGSYLDPGALPDNVFITKNDIEGAYKQSPSVSLGVRNNTTFDITLSQLIFSGEYLVGLLAVKVIKEVSEKALTKTESQTKETVAGTYFMVLVLGESLKVLNESLTSIDKTLNDLVKMNQQGFNEDTDVDQIRISWSDLKRLITSVEAQREVSIKLLKYQMGMNFDQEIELTDSIPYFVSEGNMQYLVSPVFDLDNSIDYRIVSQQVEVASILLRREQSKYLPTVSAFYRRHEQTNAPSFNFAVKDLIGLSLNIPIFTSGQRSSKVSQARLALEKSQLDQSDAGQGLILEFENALTEYQTAYNNFKTNSESIKLSKRVYDKTLIKYQEGVTSSFELSQNQTQFLTSESNYYSSILTLLNAKAKLDRILEIN